ncbi:LytR/AlgR family response regulator transcription factor [Haliea sp. E17]|uniref:LytR/AlgR family response regulator transcription factor n=1 Tax=Haliea sp. E17 TaxID=3401576 RepID=UPI003AAD04B1
MKILVVDDEPLARQRLIRLLARLRPQDQAIEAHDGEAALAALRDAEPDLLLLDIRMPGLDGIEVAARSAELAEPPAIIFCTAYDEYAMQALENHAVAYLLKPVREAELEKALAAAGRVNRLQLASLRSDQDSCRSVISCHTHRGLETLPVDQVRCFVAEQKYVTAISDRGELLLPDTLKDLEEEFGERFLRVHRNALVGVAFVRGLERTDDGQWRVLLEGTATAPLVSRRLLTQVKRRLGQR